MAFEANLVQWLNSAFGIAKAHIKEFLLSVLAVLLLIQFPTTLCLGRQLVLGQVLGFVPHMYRSKLKFSVSWLLSGPTLEVLGD